uniref:Rab9 effector protein with kelch motifs n=1 Tax=Sander lucioperca TaxID=283035 RepID=A0A8C9YJ54_SANLU
MEFLPVLDPLDKPKEGIWYSLIPRGGAPGVSVGHTCTFVPSGDGGKGRIVIVGGANPSGSFLHSHIINLDNHEWDIPDWEGMESRYEHCSFVPESCPQSLWVFGGAQQSGNRNCIQNIQLTESGSRWKNVVVNGKPPGPRTYHTNSACIGDKLYVCSGGEAGAAPVSDPKLHVFDTVSSTWSQPETRGRNLPARHGHIVVAVGSKIYIHGGMAGDKFYNDMYSLDTSKYIIFHKLLMIFELVHTLMLNLLFADKSRWFLVKFEGDMPPNRLDHSMCLLPWKVCGEGNGDKEDANSPAASETINLAFAFGGMDTQGVIHNDCIVTVVT